MHAGQTKTDAEIVQEALHTPEVFGVLIERYEAKLRRFIHRPTNIPDHDADDILQEVFIKAYRNLHNVDSAGSFSAWIYRITRNTVISEFRKKQARPPETILDKELIETLKSDISLTQSIDNTLLKDQLDIAIKKLPLKYREVIILKYIEEKSYEEISDILRKPAGTVATLLSRAKKQLHKHLEKL